MTPKTSIPPHTGGANHIRITAAKIQKKWNMELYLEPIWAKKDTKFQKGHIPWNKGVKGWTTRDPEKRRRARRNLAKGRIRRLKNRPRIAHNAIPTSVYNLSGEYLGSFSSATIAAKKFGECARNVRSCVEGKRKRCGKYMFRKASVVIFNGELMVKKENIEPYL